MGHKARALLTMAMITIGTPGTASADQRTLVQAGQHAPCSSIDNYSDCIAQQCTGVVSPYSCSGSTGTTQHFYVGMVDAPGDGRCGDATHVTCLQYSDDHPTCTAHGCTWYENNRRRPVVCVDEDSYMGPRCDQMLTSATCTGLSPSCSWAGTSGPCTGFVGSYDSFAWLDFGNEFTADINGWPSVFQEYPVITHDWFVQGDVPSTKAYGNVDTMRLVQNYESPVHSPGTLDGFCGTDPYYGAMRGYWLALSDFTYNGHWVELHGDYENDIMNNTITVGDTSLVGGAGNDQLTNWQQVASLVGEDGDDNLCSCPTGGNSDLLSGGNGSDCLRDYSGAVRYHGLSCGAPTLPVDCLYGWTDLSYDGSCECFGTSFTCGCSC